MKKFFTIFLCIFSFLLVADDNFRWLLKDGKILLTVAEKCYIYADAVKVEAYDSSGKAVEMPLPPKVSYNDDFNGMTEVIPEGTYTLQLPGRPVHSAKISYQGCRKATDKESGVCFMPQEIELGQTHAAAENIDGNKKISADFIMLKKHEGTMSKTQMIAFLNAGNTENAVQSSWWEGKSVWLILVLLLGGGLLLNFTPCILPMIPINLAIIGAGGENTPMAGFLRGVYYAVGMICAYGALGAAAVLSGARFGELNSSMYFNFAVAILFFALAMAMGGVWNLDFSAKQNSINPMKWKIARPLAIFLMGATAALLGGACVAPAVVGMLLLAVSLYETSPILGLSVPFVFGAGMGILWIAAGATMGKVLPKPGKWMVYVKNIFAVIIALLGVYYAWIGFSLLPGKFDAEAEVRKFHAALSEAENENKMVFVDFWATWCKNCSYMERNVLSADEVKSALSPYVTVKFQAEDLKNETVAEVLKEYDIQGLPAFVILEKKK